MAPHVQALKRLPRCRPGTLRPSKEFVQFMRPLSAQGSQIPPGHHRIVQARLSRQRAREQGFASAKKTGKLHRDERWGLQEDFIGILLGFYWDSMMFVGLSIPSVI